MKDCCDLHVHSVFSDGTLTPTELIAESERLGLKAVALTDHNTIAGMKEFLQAAKNSSVDAVAGVEISTDYNGVELHILGLFLAEKDFDTVTEYVKRYNIRKEQSNIELVEMLRKAGYDIDLEEIKRKTPVGHINRAHIAAELLEKGYVESVKAAFDGILSSGAGFYFPPKRETAFSAIAFLRSLGAVPVLAHPYLSLPAEEVPVFVNQAKQYGLVGMETLYSRYSQETTEQAKRVARQAGILESGGSDFHGLNKPNISLGKGEGNLVIPSAIYEGLRDKMGIPCTD